MFASRNSLLIEIIHASLMGNLGQLINRHTHCGFLIDLGIVLVDWPIMPPDQRLFNLLYPYKW